MHDIERATRYLAARLPDASGLAMVGVSHPYLHWVITIALGRAGLCTVSALNTGHTPELIQPDLIFTNAAAETADKRLIMVDQEWIAPSADALPAFVDPNHAPEAPFHLILSSGTTGTPEKIQLGHAQFQARLQPVAVGTGMLGEATSSMILVGIDTVAGCVFPMTTWFLGGRVVMRMAGESVYQTILRKRVNYAFMAPVQLGQLVVALPGVTGFVRPDVDLQIVDPEGRMLPFSQTGEVRCRRLDCVTSYLGAGGVDGDEIFRDGWFYPGDAGTLSADGLLTICGRTKELMNFGGVKMLPNELEALLAACPGVQDLAAAFARAFPRLPAISFAHTDLIPRNGMGKVQRNVIREQVQRTLANGG